MQRGVTVAHDAGAVIAALGRLVAELERDETEAGATEAGTTVLVATDSTIPAGGASLRFTVETDDSGQTSVTIRSVVELHVPFFKFFFVGLVATAQRRRVKYLRDALVADLDETEPPAPPKPVPLLPTQRFNQDQINLLATSAGAAAIAGFGAALFGQQADFVGDSFGSSDASLGVSLAITRLGFFVSLIATALADRRGRRMLMIISVSGVALANLGSAAAPSLAVFTAAQMITRGFVNATFAVAGVAAIEEAPEGARAFSTAMVAMAGGLGFTLAVLTLPLSDLGTDAWRLAFVVSGLSILLVPKIARRLPESRRYDDVARSGVARGRFGELITPALRRRFLLIGVLAFLTSIFNAPSSQLMNKYLADVHDFSGAGIAGFRAATTAIPGLIGLIVAMRITETIGRKPVGGIGAFVGNAIQILFFVAAGLVLWFSSAASVLFAAAGGIALSTLSSEIFPTEVRATATAVITAIAVAGSAIGLVLAGAFSDSLGDIGKSIAVLGIPALIAIVAIVPFLPESAGRRLDDVSPSPLIVPEM